MHTYFNFKSYFFDSLKLVPLGTSFFVINEIYVMLNLSFDVFN